MLKSSYIRIPLIAATVLTAAWGIAVAADDTQQSADILEKSDRFAVIESELCAGQAWPNYDRGCLTWITGSKATAVRYVTREIRDEDARLSILVREPATGLKLADGR